MEAADEIDNLRTKTDHCLVIDGESLQLCLDNYVDEFIEMVTLLPVVVCCRCSPTQKVKKKKKKKYRSTINFKANHYMYRLILPV
jgi:magnesium-transporting ATPase (P-type)